MADGTPGVDADMTPPSVVFSTPGDGAIEVAGNAEVVVTFSEPINAATVTAASFGLREAGAGAVTGTIVVGATTATFTPTTPLAVDRRYVATVTTAVTDLAGNSLAAEATSEFSTHRRQWDPSMPAEVNTGVAQHPQLAVDAAGRAIVVWEQTSGTRTDLWANRYVPATGWGTATLIEHDDVGSATNAQIDIDAAGNAIAVWEQSDGTVTNITASRFAIGVGWGTPTPIEALDTTNAFSPKVGFDAAGNAVVVWQQPITPGGAYHSIWANQFTIGAGWGTPVTIETDEGGPASDPRLAVDDAGNAIAVWTVANAGVSIWNLWGNRLVAGTGWGTAERIDTPGGTVYVRDPRIAMDGAGNAIVVWADSKVQTLSVWANRFVVGTGWADPVLLEDGTGDAVFPRVAVGRGGEAMVVWQQRPSGGTNSVNASRFVPATGWEAPVLIEADDVNAHYLPEIAVDDAGNAIAVWHAQDGVHRTVWANRFAGGAWGSAALLGSATGGSYNPQIAFGGGGALAVWDYDDGTTTDIIARVFQ